MRIVFSALLTACALAASGANAEVSCTTAQVTPFGGGSLMELGETWSGVRVAPGAASLSDSQVIVAYYDSDRWIRLAQANVASGQVCNIRFDARFAGWDAHKALQIAIADDGTLHIAGNVHNTPLFYARGRADDIGTVQAMPMLGRDEGSATYPTFLRTQDGKLLFSYRDGHSGDGIWLVNRWDNGAWTRIGPIFGAQDANGGPVSAYPSPIVTDANGLSHVAIVWRRTSDVATNFEVGYAQTRDFVHWAGADGTEVPGPVGPYAAFAVTVPGPGRGLLNNARLLLAPDGKPVILFTMNGDTGNDVLVAARPGAAGWVLKDVAVSDRQTVIAGGGSLPDPPRFSADTAGAQAQIRVVFPGHPSRAFLLDLMTLEAHPVARAAAGSRPAAPSLDVPAGMAQARVWSMMVKASGFDGVERGSLYWFAQNANRDQQRQCAPDAPRACDPPASPLIWLAP